jgi:tetratricopeptide (TPR) repeat protein
MLLRLLLALALSSMVAVANEAPVSPEAKRHVDAGIEAYNGARYDEAVKEFELAYRLSNRPALLFNIARAEAKLGHEEEAIAFLRRYLEERPNAPDAPAVLAEIEAYQKTLSEQQATQQAVKDAAHATELAARAEAEAQEARRHAEALAKKAAAEQTEKVWQNVAPPPDTRPVRRKAGIGLIVAGAVVAITGIALGAVAASASNTVSGSHGDFNSCCADLESRGKISTGVGIAFDVVGGAAAAAGIGLLVSSR